MRRAVVTGASGGIGSAIARTLTAEGWSVLAVDRTDPPANLEADDFLMVDLEDPGAVEAVVEHARTAGLQALINNAAASHNAPMESTDDAAFDAVVAINLRAPFLLTAGLRGQLAAATGAVVNVASVHAVATSRNVAAYAASKGGLVAFTRAAALELAPLGVRCNAVLPGATDTPMLARGLTRQPHLDPGQRRRELEARTPLGRIGRPDEIAQAVLFLADNARSSFVTGQLLAVDGGVLARLSSE